MTQQHRILVIDDDAASRGLMEQILTEDHYRVIVCDDGAEAIKLLEAESARGDDFDAVVSDIHMAEVDGLQVLDWVHEHAVETPVLLVTAFGDMDGAFDAIRRGAYDYISKPYDIDAVRKVVDRALRHRTLSGENQRVTRAGRGKDDLKSHIISSSFEKNAERVTEQVAKSYAMLEVYKTVARVALTDTTVLVVGESGTGKESVARTIHRNSTRSAGPFITVDCGTIAEGVLESELFGHARGSFTGATGARKGLFEEADGGTIFLDEIGDVGPRIQGQLLRVLQEGEIRRVGESASIKVNTRVVAATNKDLAEMSRAKKFREDLFYRLNVVSIALPPLRERREDIPLLAEHFAAKHAGVRGANITTEAREALMAYDWPGNVRELENAVARALALNPGGTILVDDLPEAVRRRVRAIEPARGAVTDSILEGRPTLDELNRRYADRVLRELGDNKTRAAEALGIDRKTLSRLLNKDE